MLHMSAQLSKLEMYVSVAQSVTLQRYRWNRALSHACGHRPIHTDPYTNQAHLKRSTMHNHYGNHMVNCMFVGMWSWCIHLSDYVTCVSNRRSMTHWFLGCCSHNIVLPPALLCYSGQPLTLPVCVTFLIVPPVILG